MNAKKLMTIVLLSFVAVSVVALVYKETKGRPSTPAPADAQTATPNSPPSSDENSPTAMSDSQPSGIKVLVYYFHVTRRCPTCLAIERQAQEVLENNFARLLHERRLEFRSVNTDLPENQHFIQDYELFGSALVMVKMVDGQQKAWANLGKIWGYVGNKEQYARYVQDELIKLLQ